MYKQSLHKTDMRKAAREVQHVKLTQWTTADFLVWNRANFRA